MTAASSGAPSMSVCMATYNGSAYVEEQIASILDQLPATGELVVYDDASRDGTPELVAAIAGRDRRVRLHRGERNLGYVRAFERAMLAATGEILLLSDQDDVWTPAHVPALVEALSRGAVAASELRLLSDGRALPRPVLGGAWHLDFPPGAPAIRRVMTGMAPYFGCAMAVRRDLLDVVLPFPSFLTESHDLWIALCGDLGGEMVHTREVTVLRRLHESNASPSRPRGPGAIVRSRMMLLRALGEARRRLRQRAASASR
jgi:glycosyltransferase involved in cell wall biosynthesis